MYIVTYKNNYNRLPICKRVNAIKDIFTIVSNIDNKGYKLVSVKKVH